MQLRLKDCLSLANAISGFLAIVFFFTFGYVSAFALVVLAAAFDFLDGFAARKSKSHDELGKQLDSLSDAVSFGVAPALIVLLQHNPELGLNFFVLLLGAVFFLSATVIRLAKYNLQEEKGVYYGLPSPFAALLLLAFGWVDLLMATVALFLLGILMVSRFKLKKIF